MFSDISVFAQSGEIIPVTAFKGLQVAGITVSEAGRLFVNFPRWRRDMPYSVIEVLEGGALFPFPDREMNDWDVGMPVNDHKFVSVQSVHSDGDKLYILDTKNPYRKGVVTSPVVYIYDLKDNSLGKTYHISAVKMKSYVHDFRVDKKKDKIYFTDSAEAGIIVLDMVTGKNFRVLDNHPFTRAEKDDIVIGGIRRKEKVHSTGIVLDKENDILYFHSLTGYTLYGIPTEDLINRRFHESRVIRMKTVPLNGMTMDSKGNLYFGDLENRKIQYVTTSGEIRTLVESERINWPNSLSIYNGYLYFTNSRSHEAFGDVSEMIFTIDKVALPQ